MDRWNKLSVENVATFELSCGYEGIRRPIQFVQMNLKYCRCTPIRIQQNFSLVESYSFFVALASFQCDDMCNTKRLPLAVVLV